MDSPSLVPEIHVGVHRDGCSEVVGGEVGGWNRNLNKGLPDGFDFEAAFNRVTAPTSFNADVKTIAGKQQSSSVKIPISLHKPQMASMETPDVPHKFCFLPFLLIFLLSWFCQSWLNAETHDLKCMHYRYVSSMLLTVHFMDFWQRFLLWSSIVSYSVPIPVRQLWHNYSDYIKQEQWLCAEFWML